MWRPLIVKCEHCSILSCCNLTSTLYFQLHFLFTWPWMCLLFILNFRNSFITSKHRQGATELCEISNSWLASFFMFYEWRKIINYNHKTRQMNKLWTKLFWRRTHSTFKHFPSLSSFWQAWNFWNLSLSAFSTYSIIAPVTGSVLLPNLGASEE